VSHFPSYKSPRRAIQAWGSEARPPSQLRSFQSSAAAAHAPPRPQGPPQAHHQLAMVAAIAFSLRTLTLSSRPCGAAMPRPAFGDAPSPPRCRPCTRAAFPHASDHQCTQCQHPHVELKLTKGKHSTGE
jgi:ribosomal protein L37E